jgi:hypothetical protein
LQTSKGKVGNDLPEGLPSRPARIVSQPISLEEMKRKQDEQALE